MKFPVDANSRCANPPTPLRLPQRRLLDQKPLPLVPLPVAAEARDHGGPRGFRLDAARELGVAGGEKDETAEAGAGHAIWPGVLHDQKARRPAAAMALPIPVVGAGRDQLPRPARLFREPLGETQWARWSRSTPASPETPKRGSRRRGARAT